MRVQGWDPVLIICQIISLQTIHYLTLSILTPSLLTHFAAPSLLDYSGGSATVSHILDWREMAGRSIVPSAAHSAYAKGAGFAWAGGKQVGVVQGGLRDGDEGDLGTDERRGWVVAVLWLIASAVDIAPLYYLVRRPTFILDFSLTLNFVHLILTTYYTKSFPTSIFFWVVQALGALLMITVAEQLCVKRELSSDLEISSYEPIQGEEEGIPLHPR